MNLVKVTVSVIKADVGSLAGHHVVHPKQIEIAKESLKEGKETGIIKDFYVTNCGDDLQLIMLHHKGEGNSDVHKLAFDTFMKAADVAKKLKLYAAGQDLLSTAFSGNVKGMGPGVAEMEFELRKADPIVVFMADKTEPSAFNLPLFRIFADPFNTAGLVIDPSMHGADLEHTGFKFKVINVYEGTHVILKTPEEMYDLLALIGSTDTYSIERIWRYDDLPAAVVSTTKLALIAHKYVGKDDPVAIVRAQHGLPAVGEVVEPFATPFSVAGAMRGSHFAPLMPVSHEQATPTRFDGPPRIMALGFQVSENELVGPADLFADVSFDYARELANKIFYYYRSHGPFMPHRLPSGEMEYTTLPNVLEKLKDRIKKD
ncbi:MAG: fructose-1,6-bisphosphate aldolase/phosphatase [Candidatus Asgardarchaeia archaeon]